MSIINLYNKQDNFFSFSLLVHPSSLYLNESVVSVHHAYDQMSLPSILT